MSAFGTDRGAGAALADAPTAEHAAPPRRHEGDALMSVRASDLEPYVGLRYLSKLFRFMAIILLLLLVAEVVTGLVTQGQAAIPTLLAEASRLIVAAGLLWGAGDLAILLIDVGHDLRATRILVGRQTAHHILEQHHEHGSALDHAPGHPVGHARLQAHDHPTPIAREHEAAPVRGSVPHRRDGESHAR